MVSKKILEFDICVGERLTMNKNEVYAGNSSAEEKFIQLFCDTFGPDKGQYVYL